MKKAIFVSFLLLILSYPQGISAQADTDIYYDEYIRNFDVVLDISSEGVVQVTETIAYDFGTDDHHGIYRFIPYKYSRNGSTYALRVQNITATDAEGRSQQTDIDRSGDFFTIRIGDPDSYVNGLVEYTIAYTVQRAINFFDNHDEFYWNATGTDWEVPILTSTATVLTPSGLSEEDITTACYTGSYASDASDCTISTSMVGQVVFESDYAFDSYEGMSIVVGFPKGVIAEPTTTQEILFFLQDNWMLILPILFWIFLHLLWRKKGKDPKGRGTVIPQYESPQGMRPGEVGALWDEKADTKDISATIIDFAVRGYIKIKYLSKKNYEFIKLKEATGDFNSMEHTLWEALFDSQDSVELSDLKNKFYKHIPDLQKNLFDLLIARKYYAKNPNTVRGIYTGIGAVVIFGLLVLAGNIGTAVAWFSAIVSATLFIIYGILMPQKTIQGAIAKEDVKGFKWFLSVTEEERLKFHNAPEKKPEQFEKFLPYAMVFGVEKEWANQFKDIYSQEPSWYEGRPGSAFSTIYFASAMSTMNSSMKSTFTSRPSSAGSGSSGFGGGGFSGGGFGGGGGGSW